MFAQWSYSQNYCHFEALITFCLLSHSFLVVPPPLSLFLLVRWMPTVSVQLSNIYLWHRYPVTNSQLGRGSIAKVRRIESFSLCNGSFVVFFFFYFFSFVIFVVSLLVSVSPVSSPCLLVVNLVIMLASVLLRILHGQWVSVVSLRSDVGAGRTMKIANMLAS